MQGKGQRKPLLWVGSAKDDLRGFPEEVRLVIGFALHIAQIGGKHPDSKPLKSFKGAGVLEVIEEHEGNAYRAVYTIQVGHQPGKGAAQAS